MVPGTPNPFALLVGALLVAPAFAIGYRMGGEGAQEKPREAKPKTEPLVVQDEEMAVAIGKIYVPRIIRLTRDNGDTYSDYRARKVGNAWLIGAARDRLSPIGSTEPIYVVIDGRDGALITWNEYTINAKSGFEKELREHHKRAAR